MTRRQTAITITLAMLACALASKPAEAHGFWSVGVRLNFPLYFGGGYAPYYPYYYQPVYVQPAPVYIQPAPVVTAPACPQPAYPARLYAQPSTESPPLASVGAPQRVAPPPPGLDGQLRALDDPDENVRAEAALQLGRARTEASLDRLTTTLTSDRSPKVREAAARALGLIGSVKALPVLQRAALSDQDRDVRHSAEFAVDVVRTGFTSNSTGR
jgi:hypothetical protein